MTWIRKNEDSTHMMVLMVEDYSSTGINDDQRGRIVAAKMRMVAITMTPGSVW